MSKINKFYWICKTIKTEHRRNNLIQKMLLIGIFCETVFSILVWSTGCCHISKIHFWLCSRWSKDELLWAYWWILRHLERVTFQEAPPPPGAAPWHRQPHTPWCFCCEYITALHIANNQKVMRRLFRLSLQ